MPVAATVAVATVAGAAISSSGAKSAAKTEATAAQNASAVQQQMYGQTRDDLAPYRALGTTAAPAYLKLLGLGGPAVGSMVGGTPGTPETPAVPGGPDWGAYLNANPDVMAEYNRASQAADRNSPAFTEHGLQSPETYAAWHYQHYGQSEGRTVPTHPDTPAVAATPGTPGTMVTPEAGSADIQGFLSSLPGYQFTKQQGIQETERTLGSRGLTGAQAKGIARFVTGLADKTYGDQVARLGAATTIGANAAAGGGQIGSAYSGQIGSNIVGAGQASAAGQVGAANAISAGTSSLGNYALANKYMGIYGGSGSAPSWSAADASLQGLY